MYLVSIPERIAKLIDDMETAIGGPWWSVVPQRDGQYQAYEYSGRGPVKYWAITHRSPVGTADDMLAWLEARGEVHCRGWREVLAGIS